MAYRPGLKRLLPQHYEIMRRTCHGQTRQQIADAVNVKIAAVDRVRGDPRFKRALRTMELRLTKRMSDSAADAAAPVVRAVRTAALEAVDNIIGLMRKSESEEMVFKASKYVADKGAFEPGGHIQKDGGTGDIIIDKFTQANVVAGLAGIKISEERETRHEMYEGTRAGEQASSPPILPPPVPLLSSQGVDNGQEGEAECDPATETALEHASPGVA